MPAVPPPASSERDHPRTAGPPTRKRRRRLVVLVAVVALGLVGAACRPLHVDNRAAGVPGVTNGSLPMSYLASTGSGCVTYDEANPSLKAMIEAARKDDVILKPTSCYRDYAGQVAARESWCERGACHMAAVPGTSNHGWGKAIDFADQDGSLTFDSIGYQWLKAWAGLFGWIHPAVMEPGGPVPEPWHWEWVGDGGKMYLGEYVGIGNSPPAEPRGLPFGALDAVTALPGGVRVDGWAIDPDQVEPIDVHVYVGSAGAGFRADKPRPDVAAAYPLYKAEHHGYSAVVTAPPGTHQVCVYAINAKGTGWNRLLGCRPVTVAAAVAAAPAAPAPAPSTTTTAPPTTTTTVPPTTTSTTPSSTTTAPPAPTTTTSPAQGTAG